MFMHEKKNQLNKCSKIHTFLFEICVLKKNGVVHVTVVNNIDMCRRACLDFREWNLIRKPMCRVDFACNSISVDFDTTRPKKTYWLLR